MGDRPPQGWHERHDGRETRENETHHNDPTDPDTPTIAPEEIQTIAPHLAKLIGSVATISRKVNCGLMPANDAVAILQNIQAAMDAACGDG